MDLFNTHLDTYTIHAEVPSDATYRKHQDVQNYVHISDREVPPRAVAVLPPALQIRREFISPRRPLPSRIRFGPVKGVKKFIGDLEVREMIKNSMESNTPLFLLKTDQMSTIHIDHIDQDKANWLGLLPLGDHTTANVWLYEQQNELYAITTKSIPSRVPLKLGYSSEYVKMHGFPLESPSIDLQEVLSSPPQEWWCYECQRALPSAALLQHHVDSEHKEDRVLPRRRHRCQRCKRTFARLFTLKRHIARYCTNRAEKQPETTQGTDKIIPNVESESNSFLDESRVPSEEILQNFTSNIDFNSLFDTYRSLDLSGSSKSTDLIDPDNQLSKDDNGMTNDPDLSFANVPTDVDDQLCKISTVIYEQPVPSSNNFLPTIQSSEKRKLEQIQQYVSDARKDIFTCECGLVFRNRDKLVRHVMDNSHSTKTAENSDIMYKCEDCQLIFKRRGMFVNHLWRVHQNVTTSIPLERRVRHYPCPGCPKVYRTAAKRNRHVRNHHPGVTSARAVESGRRACAAAACGACPRQYATRAKLLQHVRASHPAIAPPVKKNAKVQVQQ